MSPENCGVIQLLKEATFRRILAFYNAQKWSLFNGAVSLFYSFLFRQFYPSLVGLLWLAQSFEEFDQISK